VQDDGRPLISAPGVTIDGSPATPPATESVDGAVRRRDGGWTRPVGRSGRPRSWVSVGLGLGTGLILAYAAAEAILLSAQILLLVLLAAFLAVSLEPLVAGLMRLRLGRGSAVALVLLGFAAALGGFVALIIPPVSTEVSALIAAIPKWLQQVHDHNSQLGRIEDRYHIVAKAQAQFASGDVGGKVVSGLLTAGQVVLGAVSATLAVVTLTIYFLIGMPTVKEFGLRFVAARDRDRVSGLVEDILLQVGRYMLANLATSLLAGLATFIWCLAVGVPYAAMLGFVVAVMDLVPVIGSTVGGAVVSLVALSVSLTTAIASLVFYVVFRFAEDHLITPLTMKYTVRVHPVATMVAVLVLGTLMGLIGALIAVPTAAAVGLILEETVFPRRNQATG
jgi:predicted PurR-regulated permease PerM